MADRVIDPVCGMTVDPARAAGSVDHRGQTYYFCSKGCVAKFTSSDSDLPPTVPALFEVPKVPDGLPSYSVTVTHRGTQVIPKDQAHDVVRLTLG